MKNKDNITEDIINEVLEMAPTLHKHILDMKREFPPFYFEELEERTLSLAALHEISHGTKMPEDYFIKLEDAVIARLDERKKLRLFRTSYFRVAAFLLISFAAVFLIRNSMQNSINGVQDQANLTSFINELEPEEIAALLDDYSDKDDINLLVQSQLIDFDDFSESEDAIYDIDANDATLQEYINNNIEIF